VGGACGVHGREAAVIGEPKEKNRLEVQGGKGCNIEGIGCGRVAGELL